MSEKRQWLNSTILAVSLLSMQVACESDDFAAVVSGAKKKLELILSLNGGADFTNFAV